MRDKIPVSLKWIYIKIVMYLYMVPRISNFIDRRNLTEWFWLNQWRYRAEILCAHLFWAKFHKNLNMNSIRPPISSNERLFDFPFQHEKSKKLQLRFNNTPTSILYRLYIILIFFESQITFPYSNSDSSLMGHLHDMMFNDCQIISKLEMVLKYCGC